MTIDDADIRAWAREQGYDVNTRGRVRADIRRDYEQARLLPSPGDGDDDLDAEDGEDIGLPPEVPPPAEGERPADWYELPEPEPVIADPGPAKVGKPSKRGPSSKKPTVAVAQDIRAKIGVLIDVPARLWEVRDPVCGGAAVHQSAAMADAWTAVVLRSPDLVAWFTGPAGGFMQLIDVIMATYPVAMTVYAHHVAHSIQGPGEGQEQAPARPAAEYAA